MYRYALTIPANTPTSAQVEQRVKLSAGILNHITVIVPPGPANVTGLTVRYQDYQVEPWNRDGYFHGDDTVWDYDCDHHIDEPDTEVTLRGYNLSTQYPHTFYIAFSVVPPSGATTEELLQRLNTALVGE